uniref:Putative secreted protein n=1 Tax=Anopheles marajoara TaxID=58244 RepID=A0A2M4CED3_9DIPT
MLWVSSVMSEFLCFFSSSFCFHAARSSLYHYAYGAMRGLSYLTGFCVAFCCNQPTPTTCAAPLLYISSFH